MIGRATAHSFADLVTDGSRYDLLIRYDVRDTYDFHPDRLTADGRTYREAFPYHAWAEALVDAGLACPFDTVAEWSVHYDLQL